MKVKLTVIIILFSSISFGQQANLLRLEYQYHQNAWLPYSEQGAIYQDSTGAISSNSWGVNLQTQFLTKKKWGLSAGLAYRKLNYRIEDRIHRWNYSYSTFSQGQTAVFYVDRYFDDPADLVATSNSWGLIGEGYVNVFETKNLKGSVGGSVDVYLLEFYEAFYSSTDFSPNDRPESKPYAADGPNRKWFLSSSGASVFFRTTWYFSERINVGAKIGIATNLYADWEQFKKYSWLSAGLEIGFGRKPKVE